LPRDIPVGNGSFLVTFDESYCVRDIFYPYVGKENHTDGHRFRIGFWVDEKFDWSDGAWSLSLGYKPDTLVTRVEGTHDHLALGFTAYDAVDFREAIFLRKMVVRNREVREREVRVFFHHDFHILESPGGDTAYYDPDEKALIHYKENRFFLISGLRDMIRGPDQYATGVKEFRGLEGTWRDAEDGLLEGNPIAQGSVDSVISFRLIIGPREERVLYYWMAAGRNYAEVSELNRMLIEQGPEYYLRRTEHYWTAWLKKGVASVEGLPVNALDLYKKSLLILRTNIDANGAIIAACDSDSQSLVRDTYSYMWPRDGAFTAHALDMAGYLEPTRNFFNFCLDIVSEGKEASGYFLHKYHPDGCLGSSWHPWVANGEKRLPIQEDGTGLVLWALWYHFERFRDIELSARLYERMVRICGDFLASYRDKQTGLPFPSYDLWEEKWGIHTFTVSAVYGGLRAAENFAAFFGESEVAASYGQAAAEVKQALATFLYSSEEKRFLKTILPGPEGSFQADQTIDASTCAPFYLGVFEADHEMVVNTMQAITDRLRVRTDVGGIARYEGDAYHLSNQNIPGVPGNPWFFCTLWLAQWHIAKALSPADLEEALPVLEWVVSHALPSGVLAEQVDPFTNKPLSVAPLTWSHATFVSACLEYAEKFRSFRSAGPVVA
jgi:glucoamylase